MEGLQPTSEPPLRRAHRATLWFALIATTALDAFFVAWILSAYSGTAGWWLIERFRTDPLVAYLVLETLALRFAVALTALQAAPQPAMRGYALWALFVPVLGAPLALAAVVAIDDQG